MIDKDPNKKKVTLKNAFFTIRVTKDKMKALLTIKPLKSGGTDVDSKLIFTNLKKKKICTGILDEEIYNAVLKVFETNEPLVDIIIATGKALKKEDDTIYNLNRGFKHTEKSEIHTNLTGSIYLCNKGDILLSIPGSDIKGRELNVYGKSANRTINKTNIKTGKNVNSKKNNSKMEYIASIDGLAHFNEKQVTVYEYSDSIYKIHVTDNKLSASIELIPNIGYGKKLKPEEILSVLKNRKITVGLDDQLLRQTIMDINKKKRTGPVTITIAKAIYPTKESEKGKNIFGSPFRNGFGDFYASGDAMYLYVDVYPPLGAGNPIEIQEIMDYISENKITYGVYEKAILQIVDAAKYTNKILKKKIIAKGQQAVYGVDLQVEHLVKFQKAGKYKKLKKQH